MSNGAGSAATGTVISDGFSVSSVTACSAWAVSAVTVNSTGAGDDTSDDVPFCTDSDETAASVRAASRLSATTAASSRRYSVASRVILQTVGMFPSTFIAQKFVRKVINPVGDSLRKFFVRTAAEPVRLGALALRVVDK